MRKKILLTFLFFNLLSCTHASILWNIDYGILNYRKGNYKEANSYFLNYINNNPNDFEGYYWLAKTYSIQKQTKEANNYFKKAYAIASIEKNIDKIKFKNNEFNNLEDYFDMAVMFFESGDYQEADNYADMMLEIDPDSSSAYFLKARIAKMKGDIKNAQEYIKKSIILNPSILNTTLAHNLKITKIPELSLEEYSIYAAKNYFEGNIDGAIKYLKKYIEKDTNNIDIYLLLIDCYLKNNNINDAQNIIYEIIKNNENNLALILKQAEIYKLTNKEKYEETLLKAYKINPNNKELLLNLGNYYLENQKYNKALIYFETLINVDDTFYEGYFGYIYSLIETGKINLAMNKIRYLTQLNPNASEIEYLLSKICAYQAKYKEALDYITQAINKEKNAQYFLDSAKLNYILSNYENALNDLKYAPKSQETYSNIVQNFLMLENYKKAKEFLGLLDRNSISYKYYSYIINKQEGNYSQSEEFLNQIKKIKAEKIQDYIDLADINFFLGNEDNSIKTLNNGLKKYNNIFLYLEKLKIYYMTKNNQKLNETLEDIKINFN